MNAIDLRTALSKAGAEVGAQKMPVQIIGAIINI